MRKPANKSYERNEMLIYGADRDLDDKHRARDGALICGPDWSQDDIEQAEVVRDPGTTDEEHAAQCHETRLLLGLLVMQNDERKAGSG